MQEQTRTNQASIDRTKRLMQEERDIHIVLARDIEHLRAELERTKSTSDLSDLNYFNQSLKKYVSPFSQQMQQQQQQEPQQQEPQQQELQQQEPQQQPQQPSSSHQMEICSDEKSDDAARSKEEETKNW